MLILLGFLFAVAGEPPEIIVSDTVDEEIYFQKPSVICDEPCHFEQDTSIVFVEANRKHRAWLKERKIRAIYNDETVEFNYPDCDFKLNTFKCANQTGMWVMQTSIVINDKVATINLVLFDESGVVMGSASYSNSKTRTVVPKKKVTQGQVPQLPTTITNCDPRLGSCNTATVPTAPVITREEEDLDPAIVKTAPTLTHRDISQAMIYLYDSVR